MMAQKPAVPELRLRLAATPGAGKVMRERLRAWLADARIDGDIGDDLVLACSEAVNNAVAHPLQPARDAVEVVGNLEGGTVILIVRDFGRWEAALRPIATTTASGSCVP